MADQAVEAKDLPNPVPVILGVVGFILVAFVVVNVILYHMARQEAPIRREKRVGAKKAKRQKLSQGLQVLGD